MFEVFYDVGLDVNVVDEKGYMVFILVVYYGYIDIVDYLINIVKVNFC